MIQAQVSTLFMGDLESAEEDNINTRADILKVGYHGIKTYRTDKSENITLTTSQVVIKLNIS